MTIRHFPAEVYTFYDDDQIREMSTEAGPESSTPTWINDTPLAVATVPA